METKTTIKKFYTLFNSNISKFKLLIFQFLLPKLELLTVKNTIIPFLIFSTTIAFGQSGCNADLRVEKDRNIRSTPPEGTYYSMVITNKGYSSDTFSISAANVNSSCSNTDGSSNAGNVNVTTAILDANQILINEISLSSGQSATFLVHVTVPMGTPFNKWCCTEITAKSQSCSNYKVNTILHTLVMNPNED